MIDKTKNKMKPIAFWIFTALLIMMLLFSGLGALTKQDFLIEIMTHMSFPLYVMNILGSAYVLAAIAIIIPGFPKVKEWAYAGVVFAMISGLASHFAIGDSFSEMIAALMLLILATASYALRAKRLRSDTENVQL